MMLELEVRKLISEKNPHKEDSLIVNFLIIKVMHRLSIFSNLISLFILEIMINLINDKEYKLIFFCLFNFIIFLFKIINIIFLKIQLIKFI